MIKSNTEVNENLIHDYALTSVRIFVGTRAAWRFHKEQ